MGKQSKTRGEHPRITRDERVALERLFNFRARLYVTKPECWIRAEDMDYDEGKSYCPSCAEKKVEKLRRDHPGQDISVCGGWDFEEGDLIPSCETCGAVLMNSLTEHGAQGEIDYLADDEGVAWAVSLSPEVCYSMDAVLSAIGWDGQYGCQLRPGYDALPNLYDDLHNLAAILLEANPWISMREMKIMWT